MYQLDRAPHHNWIPHRAPQALPVGNAHIYPSTSLHAVSSSLPTWSSVISWSEKDKSLLERVEYSYPRFFISKPLRSLIIRVKERLCISDGDTLGLVFPSAWLADLCVRTLRLSNPDTHQTMRCVRFIPPNLHGSEAGDGYLSFSVVLFPVSLKKPAMGVWMDTGAGMTTRHAEYCLEHFESLVLDNSVPAPGNDTGLGSVSPDTTWSEYAPGDLRDLSTRIALLTTSEMKDLKPVTADDVFVFPTGMNAIFTASEALAALCPETAVVAYGWLYPETVNVLRKSPWGRVLSFKWGTDEELDQLESILKAQPDDISVLFCELPSNIKFISPNLERIRTLADTYNLIVACDETAANFVNVDILPYVDIIISSLTKMFSGASDVTGGSVVVNPNSPHHDNILRHLRVQYENVCCFPGDMTALKRNSTNMVDRVRTANINAMAVVDLLRDHPLIVQLNHPSQGPTFSSYERHRRINGGYGNILSVVFHCPEAARVFYDTLDVCKGSSFGTNFTLVIPYVQLACYWTQDKCEKYGLPRHILRISVGLEDRDEICSKMLIALAAVETSDRGSVKL
ncbi:cys/met metabolism, pyridoxal phosphate-dependent enzyme [Fusarium flagelliforme]|uniref:Cys/met metabolism, pyridoxal phosphate-dependent enzyme n=1 Tax=Fusarium flagelliforme TaxID=2675880 RepID=A0A395M6U5_9HYPO|nr:cys/met metabolism, pyridoxal phosphate-dependent enzyme [Fusarium flagelliforme]